MSSKIRFLAARDGLSSPSLGGKKSDTVIKNLRSAPKISDQRPNADTVKALRSAERLEGDRFPCAEDFFDALERG